MQMEISKANGYLWSDSQLVCGDNDKFCNKWHVAGDITVNWRNIRCSMVLLHWEEH